MNLKNKLLILIIVIFGITYLAGCEITDPPLEPGTPYTDDLKLTRDYIGKDFLEDGIGIVQLVNPVDGDTALFKSGSKSFSVRFLGINTPESTYKLEPWGEKASLFTKTKLMQAEEIVLESEGLTPEKDSNDRYLAWVWVDGRLLNLELVEESYTSTKGLADSKYEQVFYEADLRIQKFKIRIWSSKNDPDFDYSREGIETTIEELKTTPLAKGTRVRIQGIVSRVYGLSQYQEYGGYSAYIQEQNEAGEWFGVYVYGGFSPIKGFKPGQGVVIEGATGDFNGVFQITDTNDTKVKIISMGHEVEPIITLPSEIKLTNTAINSLLVKVENLTLNGKGYTSPGGGFTVYTTDGVDIRIDAKVNLFNDANERLKSHQDLIDFINNRQITIVGPVSEYDDDYQIMLTDLNDIEYLN